MPSVTTRGVVVRLVNYRDHDRMLTLLSPQLGRVDALSRGCRRPRSALLAASELFVSGEFVLFQSREHAALTSCQIDDTFFRLLVADGVVVERTCHAGHAGVVAVTILVAHYLL